MVVVDLRIKVSLDLCVSCIEVVLKVNLVEIVLLRPPSKNPREYSIELARGNLCMEADIEKDFQFVVQQIVRISGVHLVPIICLDKL